MFLRQNSIKLSELAYSRFQQALPCLIKIIVEITLENKLIPLSL